MRFVVFLSILIATVFAHPQRADQTIFNDPTADQPPCPCRQTTNSDGRFYFPNGEYSDPFQRNARSAIEAAMPLLQNVESKDAPVPDEATEIVVDPAQYVGSNAQIRSMRAAMDSSLPAYESQYPQYGQYARRTRSPSEYVHTHYTPGFEYQFGRKSRAAEQGLLSEFNVAQLQGALDSAGEAVSLQPQVGRKVRSEEVKTDERKEIFESVGPDAPAQSFGMYYMRVQSFNSVDTPDGEKGAEAEAKADEVKSNEPASKDDDIIDALQELLLGQLAMLRQQQQMEQWSRAASQQHEAYLKDIQRQLERLNKVGPSTSHTSTTAAPETSSNAVITSSPTTVATTTGAAESYEAAPNTEATTTRNPMRMRRR